MQRSPMVTRNFLLATAGKRSTCSMAWPRSMPSRSRGAPVESRRCVLANRRIVCGGLPSSVCKGMSTGVSSSSASSTVSRCSRVASPTTAYGHRSRRQIASSVANPSSRTASTKRSWASLHQISIGERAESALGTARKSKRPPTPASRTSSGSAFESPPAPTSWIRRMGLSAPSAQQRSITSWQRRCISALSRCTEAKSSPSSPSPLAMLDAAPPPRPMSIAGPPSTISLAPGGTSAAWTWASPTAPTPPAIITGLW